MYFHACLDGEDELEHGLTLLRRRDTFDRGWSITSRPAKYASSGSTAPIVSPAIDARYAADHRDFVERDRRDVPEVLAEPVSPGLHNETRIIGEAQRKRGDATGSDAGQESRPAREK